MRKESSITIEDVDDISVDENIAEVAKLQIG
jgi:hypothetical protein